MDDVLAKSDGELAFWIALKAQNAGRLMLWFRRFAPFSRCWRSLTALAILAASKCPASPDDQFWGTVLTQFGDELVALVRSVEAAGWLAEAEMVPREATRDSSTR
jgi:hypothetical protein